MWLRRTNDVQWQLVFTSLGLHLEVPTGLATLAPSKPLPSQTEPVGVKPCAKPPNCDEGNLHPVTPERSEKAHVETSTPPKDKLAPSRVNRCRPADFDQPGEVDMTLRAPKRKRLRQANMDGEEAEVAQSIVEHKSHHENPHEAVDLLDIVDDQD